MKWLLVLLLFVSCSIADKVGGTTAPTQLKIINQSGGRLAFVTWSGMYFGDDSWAGYYGTYYGLFDGNSDTVTVTAGNDYVYFYLDGSSFTHYRTVATITVSPNQLTTYTLWGSTMITPAGNIFIDEEWCVPSGEVYTYDEVRRAYKNDGQR